MNKDNVIAKNEMTVKDDVFNSIVNGIKTPIEKDVDIQKAEKSNVFLKGKQLQRFKYKIIPEFTKSFQNEGLIHDYVQASREEYEKLKVEEVKAAYEASIQEIKELNEEVDDELEEIESDKKGFIYFLKKGWTIFKWVTRLIRFYAYYRRIIKNFDESKVYNKEEKRKRFELNDYNFDKKLDREKAKDDFVEFLDGWGRRNIEKIFEPFLTHLTAAILTFADMAYNKINRGIYWWIGKELAIIGASAAIGTMMAGPIGTVLVGSAMTAYRAYKVSKFLNGVLKFARLGNKVNKAYRNFRRYQKTKSAWERTKMGYKIIKRLKRTNDIVYYGGQALQVLFETGGAVFDIVSINKEDIIKLKKDIRNYTEPLGKKLAQGITVTEQMILPDGKIAYDKLIASTKHTFSNFAKSIFGKYEEKFGTQLTVKNFFRKDEKDKMEYTFDLLLNSIGNAKQLFDCEYGLKNLDYFPFEKNEDGYIVNGKQFTMVKMQVDNKKYDVFSYGSLVYNENIGVGLKKDDSNITFLQNYSKFVTVKQMVVLDEEKGNKGKEFLFNRFGGLSGVHLFLLTRGEIKDKTKFNIDNKHEDKVHVFVQKDGRRKIKLGIEKVQDESAISIPIRNVGQSKIEQIEVNDLSVITNSRNEWLLQEKEFLEKTKLLKETIDKIVNV